MSDGSLERIADVDRQAVVEQLRAHCGEGRIDLDEFSERVGAVLAAKTRGELEAVMADLPVVAESAPVVSDQPVWVVSLLGGAQRSGRWRVGRRTHVVSVLGETELDLCRADVPPGDVHLTVFSLVGEVEVVVPSGWDVELSGFTLLGRRRVSLETPRLEGAPVLHLRVWGLLGEVRARDGLRDRRRRHRGPFPPLPPIGS